MQEEKNEVSGWSINGLNQLIRSLTHKTPSPTIETISIEAILKSSLYIWHKTKGEKSELTTSELINFISLENSMNLAFDENINQEDRDFIKLYLSCLPGFHTNLAPEKQPDSLKNLFSAAQLLIIADHVGQ